jgi:hypothetical protein
MIHWAWLLAAVNGGVFIGFILACLARAGKDN